MVSKVEQHRPTLAQHPLEPGVLVVDVQDLIGHEGADERVHFRCRRADIGAGHERAEAAQRLLVGTQLQKERAQRVALWAESAAQRHLGPRMEESALRGCATFIAVRVEQAGRRPAVDVAGDLPCEVGCVEHASVDRDSTRGEQVGRITGQEHAAGAIPVRLLGGVAEPRHSERLAER